MATLEEAQRFLATVENSWQRDPDRTRRIFHEGGGVSHSGYERPLQPDIEDSMTDLFHAVTDDTQVRLLNWALNGDTLFTEWVLTCTLEGKPFRIHGVNRFTLDGDRAREATGFVDRLATLQFFRPEVEDVSLRKMLRAMAEDREGK